MIAVEQTSARTIDRSGIHRPLNSKWADQFSTHGPKFSKIFENFGPGRTDFPGISVPGPKFSADRNFRDRPPGSLLLTCFEVTSSFFLLGIFFSFLNALYLDIHSCRSTPADLSALRKGTDRRGRVSNA